MKKTFGSHLGSKPRRERPAVLAFVPPKAPGHDRGSGHLHQELGLSRSRRATDFKDGSRAKGDARIDPGDARGDGLALQNNTTKSLAHKSNTMHDYVSIPCCGLKTPRGSHPAGERLEEIGGP